jgi:GT2 family glycosyltransferase
MALGVVILNWNDAASTLECVRSVRAGPGPVPEVWVVDNGSNDGSPEQIGTACPEVELVRSEINRGFAGGNNLGIAAALEAGCDSILLLNNDASIAPADLARLQETLERNPHLGILGPVLYERDSGALLAAGGRDISRHIISHRRPESLAMLPRVLHVDYVSGTVALLRSEMLSRVGLLDENYFFSGEMADLCERARMGGYLSGIDKGVRAYHDLQRSSELRSSLHAYYIVRNRFLFIKKFRQRRSRLLFLYWMAYGLALFGVSMVRGQRAHARAVALGLLDGWRGRWGGQNARVLGVAKGPEP